MDIRTQAVVSNGGRVFAGRIFPGCDLVVGIKKICKENHIRFGVVTNALGSLSKGCIVYAVPSENSKLKIKYSDNTYIEGPLELLCCQGIIGEDEKGEVEIHLHGVMSNKDMEVIGGHFVGEGNAVLATAEVTILEITDSQLIRKYDKETEFPLFNFIQNKDINKGLL